MFIKVRRWFTLCAILFLLLLFTVPSFYLRSRCRELNELCDKLLSASQTGEAAEAAVLHRQMRAIFEGMKAPMESFLDHAVVDEAALPLTLMGVYLDAGDETSMKAAAAQFRMALSCMQSIEGFDLRLFL